jgi:hypothetical protein
MHGSSLQERVCIRNTHIISDLNLTLSAVVESWNQDKRSVASQRSCLDPLCSISMQTNCTVPIAFCSTAGNRISAQYNLTCQSSCTGVYSSPSRGNKQVKSLQYLRQYNRIAHFSVCNKYRGVSCVIEILITYLDTTEGPFLGHTQWFSYYPFDTQKLYVFFYKIRNNNIHPLDLSRNHSNHWIKFRMN